MNLDHSEIALLDILELRNGSKKAFDLIYHAFRSRIYAALLKIIKSEEDSQDVLQDVFVRLWQKREQIDPEQSFQAYLFQIARNAAWEYLRTAARDQKRKAHLLAVATENYVHIEETIYYRESSTILHEAIQMLPEECRKVFQLVRMEEKTHKETAVTLHISPATVNNQLTKANRIVREYFMNAQKCSHPLNKK